MEGITIDIIDVLFVIMATFGFYFGFTFGLLKLALVLFSFLFATLAAMAFTPMTTNIIMETFAVDSVFLPFIACFVTLLIVLMLARLVTKLLEETLTNERFDILSRAVGGFLMAIWFSLLYSVLVIFFGKAGVFKLVFNEQAIVQPKDPAVRLGIPPKTIPTGTDTLYMEHSADQNRYVFGNNFAKKNVDVSLGLGFVPNGKNKFKAYVNKQGQDWTINEDDTITITGTSQLLLQQNKKMICFCDSSFQVHLEEDQLIFDCLDKDFSAKSIDSRLYPYIEQIPKRGTQLLKGFRPFIKKFSKYMGVAVERLQNEQKLPEQVIQTNSEKDNKTTVQPTREEEPVELDNTNLSVDTMAAPNVRPSEADKKAPELKNVEEDSVKHEG